MGKGMEEWVVVGGGGRENRIASGFEFFFSFPFSFFQFSSLPFTVIQDLNNVSLLSSKKENK